MDLENKYPDKFSEGSYVVIKKTFRGDGWTFEGVLPIVRRKGDLITIEAPCGAQYSFTIQKDHFSKETSSINQMKKSNMMSKQGIQRFEIIPFRRK